LHGGSNEAGFLPLQRRKCLVEDLLRAIKPLKSLIKEPTDRERYSLVLPRQEGRKSSMTKWIMRSRIQLFIKI
jgi:hypothetical protein